MRDFDGLCFQPMSPLRTIAARHRRYELLRVSTCATLGRALKLVDLVSTALWLSHVGRMRTSGRADDPPGVRERCHLPTPESLEECP